jgi:two-component system, chemotaxis family, CheB/CheR fusion protein
MSEQERKTGSASEEAPPANPQDQPANGDGATLEAQQPEAEPTNDKSTEQEGKPAFEVSLESAAEEHQKPSLLYPVVAFGASAGGLQAMREILENLDAETGMSFVLVTHLAPHQKSFMSEIVERYTRMPVVAVEGGQKPLPNHLYVVQPNQSISMHEGSFHVEPVQLEDHTYRTIDKFFHSLAVDLKNHAVGVVLSGADSDGALGLKAIKAEGGIAIVQTPETASHAGMPRSSIAADHVDMVLPPAEIAVELSRMGHQFMRPELRSLEGDTPPAPDDEQSLQKILQLLRGLSGLDLRPYKPETIRRRIARRMLLLRMDRLTDYGKFLQARTDELRLLQEDVLINVTHFFRDPGLWDSLRNNLLPGLLQDREPEKPIRIWCAGCSTGEEAYSLAITVLEYLSHNGLDSPVQIFGTDVSEQSIETARLAVYPETIVAEINPERLRRYFVKVDRGYQVSKRMRDTCIFARQNLCTDPPFSHIDILSCRNVMIYFKPSLQRQIMLTFHYALEPGGYILLGMSEGLRDYGDVFTSVDRKHKIYMKTGAQLPFNYAPPSRVLTPSPTLRQATGLPSWKLRAASGRNRNCSEPRTGLFWRASVPPGSSSTTA